MILFLVFEVLLLLMLFIGGHVVQFRSLLDGFVVYPRGIFAAGRGVQSVSVPCSVIHTETPMHMNPQVSPVVMAAQTCRVCRTGFGNIN